MTIPLQLEIDETTSAAYIYVQTWKRGTGAVKQSYNVGHSDASRVIVDLDQQGRLFGIEILDVELIAKLKEEHGKEKGKDISPDSAT